MNAQSDPRPAVPMSQEENHALGSIRADIAELRSVQKAEAAELRAGQKHLTEAVADFVRASKEQIGETRTELRELAKSYGESRSFKPTNILPVLGMIVTLGGPAIGFLALRIDNALGPVQTQIRLGEVDRQLLHEAIKQEATARTEEDRRVAGTLVGGKEARLEEKREGAIRNTVQDCASAEQQRRIAELWQEVFHRPMAR